MQKRMIAMAVLAAGVLGVPALSAADETPMVKGNVEIYGQAKVSVDSISTNYDKPQDQKLTKVSSNSSRLGIKGSEGLSDDLSAVYQMEFGVNMDGTTTDVVTSIPTTTANPKTTSVNTLSMRNTFAGIKSKAFGTVFFGVYDTPYKVSTGRLDAFADTMADYNAIMGNVNGTANFDLRPKDEVYYTSPTFAGVNLSVARSVTGSETDNKQDSNASLTSAMIAYDQAPLYVTAAYEVHKSGITSWDSKTAIKGTKFGAGYTIEVTGTKLGVVYESLKDDASKSNFSRNAIYAAVSQKLGAETLKLAYGKASDGENDATKTGATFTAFGIDHAFSKRTTIYALYAKTSNNSDATYGLGQSGAGGAFTPSVAGKSPSVISLGMAHQF
ncbi:MAG: porin [Nitrospiraceae bacterium]|nr:porin [Nitrospiraceae bacterium]